MKKILVMVAAVILVCSASVMTSCTSDTSDNPSQEQAKKNRKEFIEHTRSTLKELAENMNFKAVPNLNRFLINFNDQVMLNDKYNHELALILNQKIMESIRPMEESSELSAKGFKYQATVNLTEFNYKLTAESATYFNVEPAEDFEIVFYNAETNVHVNILFQASGSTVPLLSHVLSNDSVAVIMLVPEKFRFVLSNDMDGTMRPWLTGNFTTSLKKKDGRPYFDAIEDEFRAEGHIETGHRGQVTEFIIVQDPANHKAYNDFNFVLNGKEHIALSIEGSDQTGTKNFIKQFSGSIFDFLLAGMDGLSVDKLKLTLNDDLITEMRVTDCAGLLQVYREMVTARRNYADQQTIEGYVNQLNQFVTGTMTCKSISQEIPMRIATAKIGVDWWAVPALNFADENGYVPVTEMLDKESIEYGINIIDHSVEPMSQSIIIANQILMILNRLNALK